MTSMHRRAAFMGVGVATRGLVAVSAAAQAPATEKPPAAAAPAGSHPVTVVLRLSAKDPEAFKAHLMKTVPVTRVASGCRYSHSFQDPQNPAEFILIQGWDSAAQQQAYVAWRKQTGDLKLLMDFLAKPPVVETFELFDA